MNLMFGLPETAGLDAGRRCCRDAAGLAAQASRQQLRHRGRRAMAVRTQFPGLALAAASRLLIGVVAACGGGASTSASSSAASTAARSQRRSSPALEAASRICASESSSGCARGNAAESELAIERAAQQKLAQQMRARSRRRTRKSQGRSRASAEHAGLRGGKADGLGIYRFKVEPTAAGRVPLPSAARHASGSREHEFDGRLSWWSTCSAGGAEASDDAARSRRSRRGRYQLAFKYYPAGRGHVPGQPGRR